MPRPAAPTTSIEDSCLCGARVYIVCPDARLGTDQHDMWMEAHEVCREIVETPFDRVKDRALCLVRSLRSDRG
jgi:hypothetical protein